MDMVESGMGSFVVWGIHSILTDIHSFPQKKSGSVEKVMVQYDTPGCTPVLYLSGSIMWLEPSILLAALAVAQIEFSIRFWKVPRKHAGSKQNSHYMTSSANVLYILLSLNQKWWLSSFLYIIKSPKWEQIE